MSSVTTTTPSLAPAGCVEPRELDILVGKSTECRRHRGSRCFAVFVESYRQHYQSTKNKHKRGAITLEMYQILTSEQNQRFLKFDDTLGGYKEVSPKEARDKITHALKYAQKKHTKNNKTARQVPGRNGSASSHRSETSNATSGSMASLSSSHRSMSSHLSGSGAATTTRSVSSNKSPSVASSSACIPRRRSSLDWDQLLKQQQLNLRNSLVSLGTANNTNNDQVTAPPAVQQRHPHVTKTYSMNSQATRTTQCTTDTHTVGTTVGGESDTHTVATTTVGEVESDTHTFTTTTVEVEVESSEIEPIPFDVSTTQYVDMFFPSVNREAMDDRLPKIPTRPLVADEVLDDFCPLFDEMTLEQDAVLASERAAPGGGLDPLLEACSDAEGSHTSSDTPPQCNVGGMISKENSERLVSLMNHDDASVIYHPNDVVEDNRAPHHHHHHHMNETTVPPSRLPPHTTNNEDAMPKIPSRLPNDYYYCEGDGSNNNRDEGIIMDDKDLCPLFDEMALLDHDDDDVAFLTAATERQATTCSSFDPLLESGYLENEGSHTSSDSTPPQSNVSSLKSKSGEVIPPSMVYHPSDTYDHHPRETEDIINYQDDGDKALQHQVKDLDAFVDAMMMSPSLQATTGTKIDDG